MVLPCVLYHPWARLDRPSCRKGTRWYCCHRTMPGGDHFWSILVIHFTRQPFIGLVPRLQAHTVWGIQILEEKRESLPFAAPLLSLGNQNRRGQRGLNGNASLPFISASLPLLLKTSPKEVGRIWKWVTCKSRVSRLVDIILF